MPLSNAAVRDIETVIHPYTNLAAHREVGPTVLERGTGIHVFDSDGKKYVEGMSGLWCTALGYDNKELVDAAVEQFHKLPFSHVFAGRSHDPAIALAEKLKEIAPCPISKVLFASSGSEANDAQIKLVWYYNNARGKPDKKKIISRIKAYHGVTVATASLTGLVPNHRDFDLPIAGIRHTSCPHHYRFARDGETEEEFASRLAEELAAMILEEGPDTVAAFIAEPVLGAGGVIVPPKGYYPKIESVLRKYDILFIDDEVICGFGRLGEMFGATAMEMSPDSVSVAKALSSAYQPISATLIPDVVYEAMLEESRKIGTFGHGHTYAAHPVAAAVALKTIEIYQRDDIVGHVRAVAPAFQSRLRALGDHPLVGEARGLGLIGGIELVRDRKTGDAFDPPGKVGAIATQMAQAQGVLVRNLGDTIAVCPPLIITEDEIGDLFDRIGRAIDRTADKARSEGLL